MAFLDAQGLFVNQFNGQSTWMQQRRCQSRNILVSGSGATALSALPAAASAVGRNDTISKERNVSSTLDWQSNVDLSSQMIYKSLNGEKVCMVYCGTVRAKNLYCIPPA